MRSLLEWGVSIESPQIKIDPLVEGNRVAVAAGLPVAGHAGLHQQPLALVVVVGCYLVWQRRTRAHYGHPFCQDEKTRLPAEMLRLDSRTICFLEFEPPDFYSSFRPSSTMNRLRKAASKSDSKSSHWGIFPMGRFFAGSLRLHKPYPNQAKWSHLTGNPSASSLIS